MTRLAQRSIAIAIGLLTFTLATKAQEVTSNPPPPPNPWHDARNLALNEKLDVVTTAEPGKRHHCTIKTMDDNSLTCAGHLHPDHTYRSDEIEALIVPAKIPHPHRDAFWGWVIGGGIIGSAYYGIYLLALLGPAGLATACLLGIVLTFDSLMLAGEGVYEASQKRAIVSEAIIYVKPGTTYAGVPAK